MKKFSFLLLAAISSSVAVYAATSVSAEPRETHAASGPVSSSLSSKMNIDLNDNSETDIRSYYSSLNSLSASERTGTNLLKNLKPILQNFNYYSYDAVWKIYEITDREWSLSPASETTYGTYNASTRIISNYEFGSSSSNGKNNPYVHTLYRNRDDDGVTVESGRIREWGDHTQNGGTNREHVWCQSRGFKADSGAEGPAGTDIHHLLSGDGYVNGKPHNNNPYGYVDPANIQIDSKATYAYCEGNLAGKPLHAHPADESTVVFEPQDSDKGDIARACFYMVACYNNLSGTDTITQFNPNLTLVDYATSNGASAISSSDKAVGMGILSDLLEWHKLDPVDEYEIHRNNLIYNNFQHNRNPFIDFPEWVDLVWGDAKGTASANPASDAIGEPQGTKLKVSTSALSIIKKQEQSISASTPNNEKITWSISDENVAKLSKSQTDSGESVTISALKVGSATITAKATIEGEEVTSTIALTVEADPSSLVLSETSSLSLEVKGEKKLSATTKDDTSVKWTISDGTVASLSATESASGAQITVTALKEGKATITVSATVDGDDISKKIEINVGPKPFSLSDIPIYAWIGLGVVVLIIIILLIVSPKFRKKAAKQVKSAAKSSSSSKSSGSRSKSSSSSTKKKTSSSKK